MKFDALVNHLLKENTDEPLVLGITCYDDGTCKRVEKSATYYYKTYRGKLHREDGPAIEYKDGYKEWYLNDKELTKEEFDEYLKKKEIKKEIQSHKNNRIDPGMLEDYL